MYRFGIFLLMGIVTANDLAVGPHNIGHKIFEEKKEASPAIWRQVHNVTINATNDEIINSINIVDRRPEKDGEANIVDGGVGHQNVTVELKSPAVFRGYDFQIQVFAVPISEFKGTLPEQKASSTPSTLNDQTSSQHVPILTAKDSEHATRVVRKNNDVDHTTENAKAIPKTDRHEQPIPKILIDEHTPKVYEATSTTTDITTPTEKSNDDKLNVPKVLINKPLFTDVPESTVLPTTEDEAQMIDINGQNPTVLNHYPPITHEEQGDNDGHNTQLHTVSPSPVPSHPNPTVYTRHDLSSTTPKVNEDSKTSAVNDNHQQESRGLKDKHIAGMMPLPYVNH